MNGDLEVLERDIACGLEVIAKVLHERYQEFQQVLSMAEEDLFMKMQDLENKVEEKLKQADSFIRESSGMDSSGEKSRLNISTQDRILRKKLSELSECRELLDKIQEIKGLLVADQIDVATEAKNLLECEAKARHEVVKKGLRKRSPF